MDRADPAEPQLSPRHRETSADGQLVGGQERLRGDPGIVRDRDVGELDLRRKDAEADAAEVDLPLQQLRKALLRDALHQILEAVRVPDRVRRQDQEQQDDPEQTMRVETLRLAQRRARFLSFAFGHARRIGLRLPDR
jgi:hypothetical protein